MFTKESMPTSGFYLAYIAVFWMLPEKKQCVIFQKRRWGFRGVMIVCHAVPHRFGLYCTELRHPASWACAQGWKQLYGTFELTVGEVKPLRLKATSDGSTRQENFDACATIYPGERIATYLGA